LFRPDYCSTRNDHSFLTWNAMFTSKNYLVCSYAHEVLCQDGTLDLIGILLSAAWFPFVWNWSG
jgi:hypothetical protein